MERASEILRRQGLRAKRSWGQSFLSDEATLASICDALKLVRAETVVELGGGLGHLSRKLCESGARVFVVERDRDLAAVLRRFDWAKLIVVEANATKIDFSEIAGTSPLCVVGNLPYHLSSAILFRVFEQHRAVSRAVFTLQKEVAERITAAAGNRKYGLLSVLLGLFFDREFLATIPPALFYPSPKVDSAIIRLIHRSVPQGAVSDLGHFKEIVKAAFGQRRKTLLNALSSAPSLGAKPRIHKTLTEAGIDPMRRAEMLSPEEFAAIERAMASRES
jgi:16S rRNA (adenine1518-N6/adenine1519-N6)-dimethyltransferase